MKQYQFNFSDSDSLKKELTNLKEKIQGENVLFQILSEELNTTALEDVRSTLKNVFPGAPYLGYTTAGNIVNCNEAAKQCVIATVFEKETSKFLIKVYDTAEKSADETAKMICQTVEEEKWIKAVEVYYPITNGAASAFCDELYNMRPEVQLFGGIVCSGDLSDNCLLFSSESETISAKKLAAIYYGGEDLHIESIQVKGWRPLGKVFKVTDCEGSLLKTLDDMPAYEVYRKYLNIGKENFFVQTLEFPLIYDRNIEFAPDVQDKSSIIMRVPMAANDDGSLPLSSDIEMGAKVRMAYGEPGTIIESIKSSGKTIADFCPDVIRIISCAARKVFWSATTTPTFEIEPLEKIASSNGFFARGELLRSDRQVNMHNETLVFASMREGEKKASSVKANLDDDSFSTSNSFVTKLATFISATSEELEETNKKLLEFNEKLKEAAIIDGLTGIFNRKEIQSQIEKEITNGGKTFSLIMMDIDNFKKVNDTYGHQMGDEVIITLANILKDTSGNYKSKAAAGRWGGEEFMLLLRGTDAASAGIIAELIRQRFSDKQYSGMRPQTISLGVTQSTGEDNTDSICVRVDEALYKAKTTGKNRVVTL